MRYQSFLALIPLIVGEKGTRKKISGSATVVNHPKSPLSHLGLFYFI